MPDEFDLIERYFAHLTPLGNDVRAGVGDDCARVVLAPEHELAVSVDTLLAGVHFPVDTPAADIGWKALACGLSDLAAAGAQPAWCTLALTLNEAEPDWLEGFSAGLAEAARAHGVALIGGDTTRGRQTTVTVQVAGQVGAGRALGRGGARPGDALWVSGWPGEAAAGLAQWSGDGPATDARLRHRLLRPTPRIALGRALAGRASACIDVSDGLAQDAGHLARASGVAIVLDADALPRSNALCSAGPPEQVDAWLLHGGDDYELCASMPADARAPEADVAMTRIGAVEAGEGVWLRQGAGPPVRLAAGGYAHFSDR